MSIGAEHNRGRKGEDEPFTGEGSFTGGNGRTEAWAVALGERGGSGGQRHVKVRCKSKGEGESSSLILNERAWRPAALP
jgi:hypothetical protein